MYCFPLIADVIGIATLIGRKLELCNQLPGLYRKHENLLVPGKSEAYIPEPVPAKTTCLCYQYAHSNQHCLYPVRSITFQRREYLSTIAVVDAFWYHPSMITRF